MKEKARLMQVAMQTNGKEVKSVSFNFAVVTPLCAGWGKAPLVGGRPNAQSRWLSEIRVGEDGVRELLIRSFEKTTNPQDKGDVRDDMQTLVRQGCTLRLSVTKKTFEFEKEKKDKKGKANQANRLFPDNVDVIQPFTLVKLFLKPNNAAKVESKGDAVTIKQIELLPMTLYAFAGVMRAFPVTMEEQKVVTQHCKTFAPEGSSPCSPYLFGGGEDCMYVRRVSGMLHAEASEDGSGVVLHNVFQGLEDKGPAMDRVHIPADVLRRYTNCHTPERACKLLQLAACCGALGLVIARGFVVVSTVAEGDDEEVLAKRVVYRAAPIIDLYRMLCIDPAKGAEDECLSLLAAAASGEVNRVRSCNKEHGVVLRLDPSDRSLLIYPYAFYQFSEDGKDYMREVSLRVDLTVRTRKEGTGDISDLQLSHVEERVSRYCRIVVDLGPRLTVDGEPIVDEDGQYDNDGIAQFLCLQLNLTAQRSGGLAGDVASSAKVSRKRPAPCTDDVSGLD
eukprot:766331-Hanusia_phi.AAC.3